MNIVMTIMAEGRHPVTVAVRQVEGGFEAKTLDAQRNVSARAETFNGAIEKVGREYAHSSDVAA